MHALRRTALLLAVESLINGRRLVLMDLARHWPGARRVRAPLKRLDRLLGNPRLHGERERVYAGMAQWLARQPCPTLVVDWCRLKGDGRWHLLRAAVPVGGRCLTVLDLVVPQRLQGAPRVERRFLQRLRSILPPGATPVVVTDAGFRGPWCRAVERLGWHWVTRLRNRSLVKPVDTPDDEDQWVAYRALHGLVRANHARELGLFDVVRSQPLTARLVLYNRPPRGRRDATLAGGRRRRSTQSRQCARREAEPWLLAVSPSLAAVPVPHIVALYRRRMQIELAFRDPKSHRYGQTFEDSGTRSAERIEVLLLLHALATFAAWLAGIAATTCALDARLAPGPPRARRRYSVVRIGWEALARRWAAVRSTRMLRILHALPDHITGQMGLAA